MTKVLASVCVSFSKYLLNIYYAPDNVLRVWDMVVKISVKILSFVEILLQ